MTVRYPNGMVAEYEGLGIVDVRNEGYYLKNDAGKWGVFIAASAGATIEVQRPIRVVPPIQAGQLADLETRLQWAERELAATSAELRACVRSRAAYKGIVTWQKKQLEACNAKDKKAGS
jgi:hypothetical protein